MGHSSPAGRADTLPATRAKAATTAAAARSLARPATLPSPGATALTPARPASLAPALATLPLTIPLAFAGTAALTTTATTPSLSLHHHMLLL